MTSQLRRYGLWGIFAAAFMLFADGILLGASASGAEFGAIWLDRLTEMPDWRLSCGGIGGPIGACLYAIGFRHVYLALKPGGNGVALLCAAGFGASFICLGAFHAAFPFIAYMNGMEPVAHDLNWERAMTYFRFLGVVGLVPSFVSVLMLPCVVLLRQTHYPKWFALFNPGLFYLASVVFRYVPAPFGGFLMIGTGNLVFLLYFAFSTAVLWNRGDSKR